MSSNYPPGVTDAHPYFNPQEGSVHVVCGNDVAAVVPSYVLGKALDEMTTWLQMKPRTLEQMEERIDAIKTLIERAEREADYECPFEGVMDVAISEEAEWQCPLCGADRTSDTTPDERDPDEERDWRDER